MKKKLLLSLYVVLYTFSFIVLSLSIYDKNIKDIVLSLFVMLLMALPTVIQSKFNIIFPAIMEALLVLFVFATEILGEILFFYVKFPFWDILMHIIGGIIFAVFGFYIVNCQKKSLSPLFSAFVAICFSVSLSVIWEFVEFSCDTFFQSDMQKDTVIQRIATVALDKTETNQKTVLEGITDVIINGKNLGINGYLEIGIIDTMLDLFVGFIGAIIFSIFGYSGMKNTVKNNILTYLTPYKKG